MNNICDFIKKYNILIFVILGFLIYFPTLSFDFISDDAFLFINQYLNGRVSINFINFFIPSYVMSEIYIPLNFVICWLIIKIFGHSSFVFHLVNTIFYILLSISLFYLLRRIINNDLISFFAVILYILHPCHIECTAWISAMGYNVSVLFFILSFLYFISAFDENKKLNYIYSILFYILAILNQPIAITLPAILFVWIYCFRKERFKDSIKFILGYIPFLFIYLYLFYKTTSNTYRFNEAIDYTYLEKGSILGFDIFNSFIPINLSPVQPLPNIFYIIPLFLFILFIYFFRNNKLFLFFCVFGIISILPYSNIFFNIVVPLADRYLLLASISSCVLISYFSFYILEKFKEQKIIKYLSFIFFVLLYLLLFLSYLPIWRDNTKLWSYSYNANPDNMICGLKYSKLLFNEKKYFEAIKLLDNIIDKHPEYYSAYELKIEIMMEQGLFIEALDFCLKFKSLIPDYYKVYIYLFDIYINLNEYDKASEYLKLAYDKALKSNLYKNDKIDLFAEKRLILAYINTEPEEFIENFRVISNNFELLQDNGDFSKILEKTDYKSREDICLNYLKKYDTNYFHSVIQLLSCFYMKETYKNDASKIMKSLLNDMVKAQEFINKGDNDSAEKIYLSVISKNKYMYQAYYNLGMLYLQINSQTKAKDIFSKMLIINPNDKQILQLLNGLGKDLK